MRAERAGVSRLAVVLALLPACTPSPLAEKVYHHMASQFGTGFAMFQHFGVNTFTAVEHNCFGAPGGKCVDAAAFNPTELNASQWMATAKDLGAQEVCLTAHHEGGFALWQTRALFRGQAYPYGVASSPWRNGTGDVAAEFAAAARAAGIKVCYYIGPNANGYLLERGATTAEFLQVQLAMFAELLTDPRYGPVHRLWIDHPWQPCHDAAAHGALPEWTMCPPGGWANGTNASTFPRAQTRFDDLVARLSPGTIMGGSELWNGPTDLPSAADGLWLYCDPSDPAYDARSGCGKVRVMSDER